MTFGERIRFLRKQMNLSQSELAEQTGISRAIIGHYETDFRNPSLRNLNIITKALGIDVSVLTSDSDEEFISECVAGNYKAKYEALVDLIASLGQNGLDTAFIRAYENFQHNMTILKSILIVSPNMTVNSGSEQERLGLIEAMARNVCNSFDSLRGATPAAYGPELAMTKLLQADWIAISPVLQSILNAGPETQQRCLDAVDEIIKS